MYSVQFLCEMSTKRKRVVHSIKDKAKIIEELNKGVSNNFLAESHNVGTSTISDLKLQRISL